MPETKPQRWPSPVEIALAIVTGIAFIGGGYRAGRREAFPERALVYIGLFTVANLAVGGVVAAPRQPSCIARHPIVNGPEFGSSFHSHLDNGVGRHYIEPRTPRLNGKVVRYHRVYAEEFYRLLDGP